MVSDRSPNEHPTVSSSHDFAQQLINMLRRRNLVLNIIWPILLISVVALAVYGGTLYMQLQTVEDEEQTYLQNIASAEIENNNLKNELNELTARLASTEEELNGLKDIKANLEVQKGQSVTQLDQTETLLQQLRLQVAELEKQSLESAQALLFMEKKLEEQKRASATKEISLNGEIDSLEAKLRDRKTAYIALVKRQKETTAEMNRLASMLDKSKAELKTVKSERDISRKSLKESQASLSQLKQDYKTLETRLKHAIAPISNEKAPTTTVSKQESSNINRDLAFQPVTATKPAPPKSESKKAQSASFDFDSIAIE